MPNAGRSPKPPAAAPTPAFRPRAPSAPQVSPPAPKKPVAVEARDSEYDLVDSGGWDTADTVSLRDEPKLPEAKAAEAPAPEAPEPQPTPLPVTPTSPGHQSVTAQMAAPAPAPVPTPLPTPTPRQPVVKKDESVGSVVRAAVEEAVTPHIKKTHDLEAQNRELQKRLVEMQNEVAKAKQEVEIIKKSMVPVQVSVAPVQASANPSIVQASVTPNASVAPVRPSMHSTSFGPVITLPPGTQKPGEIDLSNVGPIELPDFGQRKRIVGRLVVVFMLGLVLAAFISMVASRS